MSRADIRNLDLGMLRTFDALMRERSVSRAAGRLFLSQSAVSATLNRLRTAFDDPLFERRAHGVMPTARALALAPQVQQVLDDIGRLFEAGQPFDPGRSDRVFRIAASDYQGRRFLPGLVRRLVDCQSRIRLTWEPPDARPLAERLRSGDLDLAIVASLKPPTLLETVCLYADAYVLALRRDHPLAQAPMNLQAFCALPQVTLGYGSSMLESLIDVALSRSGLDRLVRVSVTTLGQVLELLLCSDHAAVLPARFARQHAGQLALRPLPFALPQYEVLMCWHARSGGDEGLAWLRDQVVALSSADGDMPQPRAMLDG